MAQGLTALSRFDPRQALAARCLVLSCAALFSQHARAAEPGSPMATDPPTEEEARPGPVEEPSAPPPSRDDRFNPAPNQLARPDLPPRKQPRPVNALPIVSTNAPPPLIWKWPTFSTADWFVTVGASALTLTAAIVKPRAQHSLSGPIGFDEDVRNALRADTLDLRYKFRDVSDIGLSVAVSWPFVGDALTAAWWYRGSREAAQEMALIDLETLAISGAIQGMTNVIVSRERPFGPDCGKGELPDDAIDCDGSFHYRSFFSGHSSFSFTGAALVCIHHMENELLGPPWDALSCATGYAVAASTAAFRVVADVHYASDVLLGAAMGTLVGYGVPLLHYRKLGGGPRLKTETGRYQIEVKLVPSPGGLGVMGTF